MNCEPEIKGGYVLYPRLFLELSADWPLLDRCIWTYLVCKANHKDGVLKRGQLITTYTDIARAMRYRSGFVLKTPDKSTIGRVLQRLRLCNLIATYRTTRGLVITICGYDSYQSPASYERNEERAYCATDYATTASHDKQEYKNEKKKEGYHPPKSFYQMDCERADKAFAEAARKFLANGDQ
jgi:hypothetical protein